MMMKKNNLWVFQFTSGQIFIIVTLSFVVIVLSFAQGFMTGAEKQRNQNIKFEVETEHQQASSSDIAEDKEKKDITNTPGYISVPTDQTKKTPALKEDPNKLINKEKTPPQENSQASKQRKSTKKKVAKAKPAKKNKRNAIHRKNIEGRRSYAIQIGSFNSEDKALDEVARLKKKGYEGYFYTQKKNNKVWYRVRIGKYSDKEVAKNIKEKLEREEGFKTYLSIID